MPPEVTRLLKSLRLVLWKNGNIAGERLRHDVDVNGNHRLEVTLRHDEVVDDRPIVRAKPLNKYGSSTPGPRLDTPSPGKKSSG
jgi:hypothetical protein